MLCLLYVHKEVNKEEQHTMGMYPEDRIKLWGGGRAVCIDTAVQTVHVNTEHSHEPSDCSVMAAQLSRHVKHATATKGKPC